jgi:outer membrane protein assembly factor BamB
MAVWMGPAEASRGDVADARSRDYGNRTLQPEWRQPHFDAAHDGFNRHEHVLSPSNVSGLVVKWTGTAPVWFMGGVLVVGGAVYAGGHSDNILAATWLGAFDRGTGKPLWRAKQQGGHTSSGIAYAKGRVFISTNGDHQLRAYDSDTGRLRWSLQADGAVGPPTVANGVVYVQTNNYKLYALDPASGHIRWSVPYGGDGGNAGPAASGGRLFLTGDDANVVEARSASTGALVWNAPVDDHSAGSPAAADGLVFAGTLAGTLYALNADTGGVVWQANTGGGIESTPAVAGGVVYVGDDDGDLHAWDEYTGTELWTAHTDRAFVLSSPIVANGVVYAGTLGVYAFDALTGEELWSDTTGLINNGIAVVDGVLYVGDFDGELRAYALPPSG